MIKYVVNYRPLVSLSHLCRAPQWHSTLDLGAIPHGACAGARGDPRSHADRAGSVPVPRVRTFSQSPAGPLAHVLHAGVCMLSSASDGQLDRVILSHYRLYTTTAL